MTQPNDSEPRRWWIKAQGNQLEGTVYCKLSPDDVIDISKPGEDRWISTIIQTVDPTTNPVSMTAKWIEVVEASAYDAKCAELERYKNAEITNAIKAGHDYGEALDEIARLKTKDAEVERLRETLNWFAINAYDKRDAEKAREALAAMDEIDAVEKEGGE